jgi:phosphoenolpyruvate synthase/pyruvate phosphate dikinase
MDSNWLTSIAEADDAGLIGGKASALGKMIRAGFVVPAGFVIKTTVSKMTPELQTELLTWFDALNADYVAVRSSAPTEDSTDAAWAGQLDTFLNVTRANLIDHIEQCWHSTNSARAKSYAQQKSLHTDKATAVIVQAMIQSEVSGVAFSLHPIKQDSQQVVIEAGFGLGEAIVSGQITPDSYVVNKQTLEILECHVSTQHKMLVKNKVGDNAWQVLQDKARVQKLSNAYIKQLTELVTKLENYFEYPVDVEWALANDRLHVLQCRPITALV